MSKAIKKDDMVTVYGTESSPSMKTGKAYSVHRELAKKLVAKKHATLEGPKAKTKE